MTQVVTIKKECGLSNRIKSILSALRLYDKVNTVVEADSYIFPDIELVDDLNNSYMDWRLKVLPEEEEYIENYKTIDFLYEKVPQYFIDEYLKVIDKLKINPDILEYVDNFVKNWDSNTVGVHIRSWYSDYPRNSWHDNSLFENEIDRLSSEQKIFLCADNPEVIKYFTNKYGERIITHPQRLHESILGTINVFDQYQDDVQLVVDSFIDCLLLSKCDTIIGTWCSTFTEVAWWFGGCKAKVILPEPLNYDLTYNDNLFIKK